MRRHATRLSLCIALGLGLIACAGADGEPSPDPQRPEESSEGSDDSEAASASEGEEVGEATPTSDTPADGTSRDTLSFRRDGATVDFSGANNASYYQKNFGNHRLVVVLNDVLGDKYVSLDITGTNGAELTTQSYDCSKTLDDATGAKAKLTFRSGDDTWQQAVGKPCSIQVAGIGAVGERMTGSFSATLVAKGGAGPEVVVSEGTFDVTRKEF